MLRTGTVALLVLLVGAPGIARADISIQKDGPQAFDGASELSLHLGYQAGLSGRFANPSGFKLLLDYGRHLGGPVWFDVQLNPVFAGLGGGCTASVDKPSICGNQGGWGLEAAGGVKIKLADQIPGVRRLPIVIEVPATIGVVALYARQCDDGGAAAVVRTGVRAEYFLLHNLGVGLGLGFAIGPGFHGGSSCRPHGGYTDLYTALDFSVGAEWNL